VKFVAGAPEREVARSARFGRYLRERGKKHVHPLDGRASALTVR
jgi:hypothetical protein